MGLKNPIVMHIFFTTDMTCKLYFVTCKIKKTAKYLGYPLGVYLYLCVKVCDRYYIPLTASTRTFQEYQDTATS